MTRRPVCRRAALILALTLGATGCATTANKPAPQVDLGGECVGSIAELPAREAPVRVDSKTRAVPRQFGEIANCVGEAGRRRPAVLYALGALQPPLHVALTLHGADGGTLAGQLTLLDSAFQPLRRYGFDQFRRRGMDFSLSAFINPEDAAARYLLVEPDPGYVGQTRRYVSGQRWTTPIVTATVVGSYSDGYERAVEVPLDQAGLVSLLIEPYVPTTLEAR
jgi:hypothetical protein